MTDETASIGDAAERRRKPKPKPDPDPPKVSVVNHEFVGVTHDDVTDCLKYWRERLHAAIRQPMNFGPGDIEYIAENIERLHSMVPDDCRDGVCERSSPFGGERPPSPA